MNRKLCLGKKFIFDVRDMAGNDQMDQTALLEYLFAGDGRDAWYLVRPLANRDRQGRKVFKGTDKRTINDRKNDIKRKKGDVWMERSLEYKDQSCMAEGMNKINI